MRTNHLNLLLVLVLVLFPMSTRAYGADECVMLYKIPYYTTINNCAKFRRLRNAARLEVSIWDSAG